MQNIQVKRYKTPNGVWAGYIEPEDSSWILFVAEDGDVVLMQRAEVVTEEGHKYMTYVAAGEA